MRKIPKFNYIIIFLLLSCPFLLVACQQQKNDEDFQILIFSSISENSLVEIKRQIKDELKTNLPVDILLYPPIVERLILEIVQHSGDILIVDRDLLAAAYDAKELYQLDEFKNSNNTIELTGFELEALQAAGESAEKGDIYFNALRVNIVEYKDFGSSELVAIIPKYTKNEEIAFSILEMIVQK